VANLRITFWGIQGSCPVFPTPGEVDDYTRRMARHSVERTLHDIADRLERGECTPDDLRKLAGPDAVGEYQKTLGLPALPIYGGDTTCIEVRTGDGHTLLFDLGTGLLGFSAHALSTWPAVGDRTIHVFASHEHLDHRSGLPFAAICFERRAPFTLHIHGTREYLSVLDERYGLFSRTVAPGMHVDDPLDYSMFAANFPGAELHNPRDVSAARPPGEPSPWAMHDINQPIHVGNTHISAFEVYHGLTRCLAYQVRHGNATFVFCTDHELRHGPGAADPRQLRSLEAERRLIERCQNADVAYFDGQYLLAEYLGQKPIGAAPPTPRMDWGHGCVEDIVERVERCRIARAYIGHHDPDRPWSARMDLDRLVQDACAGKPYQIQLAQAGAVIEI